MAEIWSEQQPSVPLPRTRPPITALACMGTTHIIDIHTRKSNHANAPAGTS